MSQAACCTCASLLAAVPRVSSSSEKPLPDDRQLDCCRRTICGACIHRNRRFLNYCPYCQTSNQSFPSSRLQARPRQGEEEDGSETETDTESEPPPYSAIAQTINPKANTTKPPTPPPPPYTSPFHSKPNPDSNPKQPPQQKEKEQQADQPPYTIHHLRHPPHPTPDSLTSLSLRYGIPAHILRQHNNLPNDADYLLAARHTLLIPTAYITNTTKTGTTTTTDAAATTTTPNPNPSHSPFPVEEAAERERKVQIRRFMVACKEPDYDAAVVYLEASGHDFDAAVAWHRADAAWERANPNLLDGSGAGPGRGLLGKRGKEKGKAVKAGGGEGRLFAWLKG
ncbi:hypothetical protein CHGG_02885 [Chaetomium globosum CBS 148.51]|uniref:LysM domain-containing protein n=1 Tax=Chaetomium globosum (strain ATCC 6205 / CBS 148.51 / DSM 1962 / NBRC 6347 / NRRL 1970) TaxID=306901 RepID=Q2HA69_CHAGB|nr:uncharacterized protein CHGG_02885 [Chaetomium globosum CBS 148.51]EAQ90950.1 hypothetical protein CHGG_02885 [Chaetomium globosum CBS 148.51]